MKRTLLVLLALCLFLAACGGGDDGEEVLRDDGGPEEPEEEGGDLSDEEVDLDSPITPLRSITEEEEPVAEDADTVMIAAAIDVERFWAATYPEVYGEEFPSITGGLWSYGPDTPEADMPTCGGPLLYDEVAENAFYCPEDDLIAWDRTALVEPFIDEFGAFTAAVVMAHEFGHAIQARTGDFESLPGVVAELQADCFAGAWVADVAEENSDIFQATLDELDVAVGGLIEIRDAPGASADDPSAHGSGFDRVSAFSDGLFEGAGRCAGFGEAPPVVTELPFTDEADAASGGNLPSDEIIPLAVEDLDDFFTTEFGKAGLTWAAVSDVLLFDPDTDTVTCGDLELSPDEAYAAIFYCIDENNVQLDAVNLIPALEEIGDFAIISELARQWAFAAQVQQGNLENTLETSLHADCLTGLYAGDLFFELRPETAALALSPGDLDEAIISFLAFGNPEDSETSGTPFQRSDAFRTGFLGGMADCDAILSGGA